MKFHSFWGRNFTLLGEKFCLFLIKIVPFRAKLRTFGETFSQFRDKIMLFSVCNLRLISPQKSALLPPF